jgi:hypothetical protein
MWASLVYAAVLFYLLTPGVLVSLPPGGSRTTVAITHALVFSVVWCYTQKAVHGLIGK